MTFLPHSWNCDRRRLAGGYVQTRFGVKWRNFLRADGQWQGIDAKPAQVGNVLQVANAPYKLEAPLTAAGEFRFEATVRYDIHRKTGIASAATGLVKRFPGALPVAAQVDGYFIRYPLAMPSIGADIVIRPHEQKVNFLYEWQALPPGSGPIECPVEFEFDGLPEVARKSGGRAIALTDQNISESLTWQANSNRGVTIKPAKAWDSLGRSAPVQLRLRRDGNRLIGVKIVPRAFVAKAFTDGAKWVRTDTTSTFYPDADTETLSVDGYVYWSGDDTWANARSGGGAGSTYYDDSISSAGGTRGQMSNTTNQFLTISRAVYLFWTDDIPDTDTVSAATLSIYGAWSSAGGGWTDGFAMVPSSPASITALSGSDYATIGEADMGTSTFTTSGWSTSSYNVVTMGGAYLEGTINKSGATKLGMRQVDDLNNSEPSWVDSSTIQLGSYFAEETGTDKDPLLTVTHAADDESSSSSPSSASSQSSSSSSSPSSVSSSSSSSPSSPSSQSSSSSSSQSSESSLSSSSASSASSDSSSSASSESSNSSSSSSSPSSTSSSSSSSFSSQSSSSSSSPSSESSSSSSSSPSSSLSSSSDSGSSSSSSSVYTRVDYPIGTYRRGTSAIAIGPGSAIITRYGPAGKSIRKPT